MSNYIYYYDNMSPIPHKGFHFEYCNIMIVTTNSTVGGHAHFGENSYYIEGNDDTRVKQWSTKDLAILLKNK